MQIIEVKTKQEAKLFLNVVDIIYKDCSKYIKPLDDSINTIFSKKNIFYKENESKRWILFDDNGNLIGRVAAFVNDAINNLKPTLAFGFFECINDQKAANILFSKILELANELNAEMIEGPVNYGSTHAFWGLLTDGFDRHPSFEVNYNPKYYIRLLENFGFKVKYNQFTNMLYTDSYELPKRIRAIANRAQAKEGFYIKPFNRKQFRKFAKYAVDIYNDAWRDNVNFIPVTLDTFSRVLDSIKKIIDENLVLFAFYNSEPISLLMCVPDPNRIIKSFNGKLGIINKLKFLFKKHSISTARVLALANKSKYRNKGVEAMLFRSLSDYLYKSDKYKELEISWVGSYNGVMLSILKALKGECIKQHTVYIKEI